MPPVRTNAVATRDSAPAPFLTVVDVADTLRITPATARALCRTGELPAVKRGRQLLISPAALAAYVAALPPASH